jgi:cbb3-type cytochrome oxidase maturation protein
MIVVYIILFASILGLTAVIALFWAVQSGQMNDFSQAAYSIFDTEEPVGQVTDRFPTDDAHRDG